MRLKDIFFGGATRSRDVVLRGIKWHISIRKDDDYLNIFLNGNSNDMDPNLQWLVETTYQLIPLRNDVAPHVTTVSTQFNWIQSHWVR